MLMPQWLWKFNIKKRLNNLTFLCSAVGITSVFSDSFMTRLSIWQFLRRKLFWPEVCLIQKKRWFAIGFEMTCSNHQRRLDLLTTSNTRKAKNNEINTYSTPSPPPPSQKKNRKRILLTLVLGNIKSRYLLSSLQFFLRVFRSASYKAVGTSEILTIRHTCCNLCISLHTIISSRTVSPPTLSKWSRWCVTSPTGKGCENLSMYITVKLRFCCFTRS